MTHRPAVTMDGEFTATFCPEHGHGLLMFTLQCSYVFAEVELMVLPVADTGRTVRPPVVLSLAGVRWGYHAHEMRPGPRQ